MMRGRNLLILLAILVLLGGSALLMDSSRKRATESTGKPLFPGLKTELIDRIKIKAEGKETVLEKREDKWLVATEGNKPAEPKPVSDILDRLTKFYADQVVSTNKANQGLFMVDSTGTEVWVDQKGKEIAHFFVGKASDDWSSTFVRAANSDRVIQVPEYLPSLFQRGESWRQRTIFSFEMKDITRFEYVSPSRGHFLASKDADGKWKMDAPEGGEIDGGKMSPVIQSMAQLRAAGFGDDVTPVAAGVEPDTTKITATLADGSTNVLVIGAPAPSNRNYVRREGSDEIFTIPSGRVKALMPQKGSLMAPAPTFETPAPGR
jgi:hypothetical protein